MINLPLPHSWQILDMYILLHFRQFPARKWVCKSYSYRKNILSEFSYLSFVEFWFISWLHTSIEYVYDANELDPSYATLTVVLVVASSHCCITCKPQGFREVQDLRSSFMNIRNQLHIPLLISIICTVKSKSLIYSWK